MDLHVSRICQTSSGGDFVVKYEAAVEVTPGDMRVDVEVLSTYPQDADAELVQRAKDSIRRGAETVLHPRGEGASIRLSRLVIHPVDFKPSRFEQFTAEEFRRILDVRVDGENAAARKPPDQAQA